jgi:cytochrome c2
MERALPALLLQTSASAALAQAGPPGEKSYAQCDACHAFAEGFERRFEERVGRGE